MNRLFLALPIPPAAVQNIRELVTKEGMAIDHMIPTDKWHITLAFIGEYDLSDEQLQELLQPLPQSFVPTLLLTHVGSGLHPDSLWVYVQINTMITQLRESIAARLEKNNIPCDTRDFIPHIQVAKTTAVVPANPLHITMVPNTVHLYRSVQAAGTVEYEVVGSISLEA